MTSKIRFQLKSPLGNVSEVSMTMHNFVKDCEAKLLEVALGLKHTPDDHYAIVFHLSKLQTHYRNEFQIKIALNIVHDITKHQQGAIFLCHDFDLIVILATSDRALLEKVMFQLRYLFIDDPLAYTDEETENAQFCSLYDIGFQWREFYTLCKQKLHGAFHTEVKLDKSAPSSAEPFTTEQLYTLEAALQTLEFEECAHFQPVCALTSGKKPQILFEELFIHIGSLSKLLHSDTDLKSNPAFFRYLTQLLDHKILTLLTTKPAQFLRLPLSLNLHLNSCLSEKFFLFDKHINPSIKNSIVIELHIADVFADMNKFVEVRSYLKQLGYRLCLDGVNATSITQIERERLGFDLVKLEWNQHYLSFSASEKSTLQEAITRQGNKRVILCRCDNEDAINFGKELELFLFQGYHLETLLQKEEYTAEMFVA